MGDRAHARVRSLERLSPAALPLIAHTKIAYEDLARSLVVLSLVEYGFSVWPSTVNSSLGLVLSLLVTLVSVYYVDSNPSTRQGNKEEVVVPVEWTDAQSKGGKKE